MKPYACPNCGMTVDPKRKVTGKVFTFSENDWFIVAFDKPSAPFGYVEIHWCRPKDKGIGRDPYLNKPV